MYLFLYAVLQSLELIEEFPSRGLERRLLLTYGVKFRTERIPSVVARRLGS